MGSLEMAVFAAEAAAMIRVQWGLMFIMALLLIIIAVLYAVERSERRSFQRELKDTRRVVLAQKSRIKALTGVLAGVHLPVLTPIPETIEVPTAVTVDVVKEIV